MNSENTKESNKIAKDVNQVSLVDAQAATYAWQNLAGGNYAFRFDKADFQEIAGLDLCYVRIYVGIKPTDGTTQMLVVGVDEQGDIIDTDPNAVSSGIYDFAMPCPDTCDPTSPLMNPNN